MGTLIIYYLIGIIASYLCVGILNKMAIKQKVEPFSSWFILLSFNFVGVILVIYIATMTFKAIKFIARLSRKIMFFILDIPYKKLTIGLFNSIYKGFKWSINTIKKSPIVIQWFVNGIKKLHFILIPPEKGIDLIILLFKSIGKLFKKFGNIEFIITGYIISIISIFIGMFMSISNEVTGCWIIGCGFILFFATLLFSLLSITDDDDYYYRC